MRVRFPRPMGITSARIVGAQRILADRAASARSAARNQVDQDSPHAAALRGKARGFEEAVEMLQKIHEGRHLRGSHDGPKP